VFGGSKNESHAKKAKAKQTDLGGVNIRSICLPCEKLGEACTICEVLS